MTQLKCLGDLGFWQQLLSSEFNRGYFSALALVVLVLILLLTLRIALAIVFRVRRCGEIVVPCSRGDMLVSAEAVKTAVGRVLESCDDLKVEKIRLYRAGKKHRMTLFCTFLPGSHCAEVAAQLKPQLLELLKTDFGIVSMAAINFRVEAIKGVPKPQITAGGESQDQPDHAADPGL